jgi:hypothetical protein
MARPRLVTLEVSISPTQAVRSLREIAAEAGWGWEREEGTRLVDRWMIIMPIARTTRSFRLAITSGEGQGLILSAWQEVGGTAGGITMVEWVVPGHLTGPPLHQLLRAWAAKHPRCPWRWRFYERSVVGYLMPVWRRSRREFRRFGFDTSKSAWPIEVEWPPIGWPDTREEE